MISFKAISFMLYFSNHSTSSRTKRLVMLLLASLAKSMVMPQSLAYLKVNYGLVLGNWAADLLGLKLTD